MVTIQIQIIKAQLIRKHYEAQMGFMHFFYRDLHSILQDFIQQSSYIRLFIFEIIVQLITSQYKCEIAANIDNNKCGVTNLMSFIQTQPLKP